MTDQDSTNYPVFSADELAAMMEKEKAEALGQAGDFSNIEVMKKQAKANNFLAKKFNIFSIPTLMVYFQGPMPGLEPISTLDLIDLKASDPLHWWKPFVSKAKISRQGYKGTLEEKAIKYIDSLEAPTTDLTGFIYLDKEKHMQVLAKLLELQVPININRTTNGPAVEATLVDYFKQLEDFLTTTYSNLSLIEAWRRYMIDKGQPQVNITNADLIKALNIWA